MAKALVLGGTTGLVGQALARTLAAGGWETLTFSRTEGNLLDLDFLRGLLEKSGADVVFNALGWTRVDAAEEHPEEALLANRTLPDALARTLAAMGHGHLVHFSTDFVFSGPHDGLWRETDRPAPLSVYGRTKLAGEEAVLHALPDRSCIVRTAWLFGPGRSNFVDVILDACRRRDVVRVVHDQVGSPTYTLDLAQWCEKLARARATGIWHAVNSGVASWCELASEAIALTSGPCRVEPIPAADWPQAAQRPANFALDNGRLAEFLGEKPRPWPRALREYLFGACLQGAGGKEH